MAKEQWQYRVVLVLVEAGESAEEAISEAVTLNRGWDRDPVFGIAKMVGVVGDKRQWRVGLRRPYRVGPDVEEDFAGINDR